MDEANQVIFGLKTEIEDQNQKLIQMEESVYEMETIQLDMLNQLKDIQSGGEFGTLFGGELANEIG